MKKELPIALGLVAGLIWIITTYFTGPRWVETVHQELSKWYQLAGAYMVMVGVVNLTRVHGHRITQKKKDWMYSIVALVCMFGIMIFGIFIAKDSNNPGWKTFYSQIIAPMNATVYSTLVFYIASAAYRAFRIRNSQATILLVSALIMMLGRVPLGAMISPVIPQLADWILNVPNVAGMRGIQIGAAFGGIATALRVLVGIERGYMGGTE
ncbi:MAG TPA: hypothetical protein GXX30_06395 [Firmicutes bacterium]|uniref:Uncharacterized protein n=1 Tax=Candidatus Fermentithermobacillus carboniphilus TaxID=3085328 RepID=A0AAT9LCZ8_9FIRM|nr:MAG: hypothetical protein IMF26_02515 [Candidatus Fermentithermobacillus carboniphilus]HHW18514.1 hypothetical protein [Candidatus Fermentithermobacillaceae bacterium]